jgi:hypothetical protein
VTALDITKNQASAKVDEGVEETSDIINKQSHRNGPVQNNAGVAISV